MSTDVLVVHSTDFDRMSLARAFRSHDGVRAKVVSSGREAIESLRRGQFSAVVSSEDPEDIDVWRLVRMIRSGTFCSSATPVVVICDRPIEELEPVADAQTYLIDPGNPVDVVPRVLSVLASRNKHTVLLVEDDVQSANVLGESLSRFFDVEYAYDGEQALLQWRKRRPDLVILDLMLPGIDGSEVLKTVRSEDPSQEIVVLTAFDSPDKHQELMLSGASEFLGKPVDVTRLLDVCHRILREHMVMANVDRHDANRAVTSRLRAADYSLDRGLTRSASSHLKAALASNRLSPMSDDDWTRLLSEFPHGSDG